MTSSSFWIPLRAILAGAAFLVFQPSSFAQTAENVLTAVAPAKVAARRGTEVQVRVPVQLRAGYHVNSDVPNDPFLIPLRLRWEPGPLQTPLVTFPKPEVHNYGFSPKPVSVFTGNFDILTKFKVAQNASRGPGILIGRLRYQACNDKACLPPKTVDIRLPYTVQ